MIKCWRYYFANGTENKKGTGGNPALEEALMMKRFLGRRAG